MIANWLTAWIAIFIVSIAAEISTTCYYRALAADGPGRRRRAMLWSGACRVIGLLLLKRVVSEEGAQGLWAASAFVAGDVIGTWLALWYADRTASPSAEASPELLATIDARVAAAVEARISAMTLEAASVSRSPATTHWRAPAARRAPARTALVLRPDAPDVARELDGSPARGAVAG